MTVLLIALLIGIVALGYYTVRIVQGDGYGSRRQPPASHHRDVFDPTRTA